MADTYYALPAGFRERLSDEYHRQIQQEDAKFAAVGMVQPNWIQTQQSFRVLAKVELVESTGQRFGDTQQGEAQVGFRSGFLRDFEGAIDFDRNDRDRLYTATTPTSETMQNLVAAFNRKRDDVIIDAASAFTYGGPKPYNTVQSPLPANMEIPVTWGKTTNGVTNTNLTIWKVQEAITRMRELDVDLDREMVTLAIPPRVESAWLQYAMSAPNTPFAMAFMPWYQSTQENRSSKFMGVNLIVSNRLQRVGNIYTCLLFAKSAFYTSPASSDVLVDIIPSRRHMIQIAFYGKFGAMRMYDEKVYLLYADTSVDITY